MKNSEKLVKVANELLKLASSIEESSIPTVKKDGIYPMTTPQYVQLDCRNEKCAYYNGVGQCVNKAPALTINPDFTVVCWSKKERF